MSILTLKVYETNNCLCFYVRDIPYKIRKNICQFLSFYVKKRVGQKDFTKLVKLYKITKKGFLILGYNALEILSRNLSINIEKILHRKETKDLPHKEKCIKLYNWQNMIIEEINNRFDDGDACILKLGTGSGKTYITMSLIETLRKKTLIIVPNTAILQNWLNLLNEVCCDEWAIGILSGKMKCDGDVVLAIVNSICNNTLLIDNEELENQDYLARFGFVIIDEIHNFTSKYRRELFFKINAPYRLGLTATPEKAGDYQRIFTDYFGDIFDGDELIGNKKKKISGKVNIIRYNGPPEYTKIIVKNGMPMVVEMHKQFAQDPYRNKLLINEINHMVDEFRKCYVMFEHKKHLLAISRILDVEHDILYGGCEVKDCLANIILCTYSFIGEGISLANMDAIIFATSRLNNHIQYIGRITRGNYNDKKIVDIVDNRTFIRKQLNNRMEFYKRHDFEIEELIVDWKNFI